MPSCTKTKQGDTLFESAKLPMCEGDFDMTKEDPLVTVAVQGFSVAGNPGRWTDGNEASFTCYLPSAKDQIPTTVRISTWGFVFAGHTQKVLISINQSDQIERNYVPGTEYQIIDLPLPSDPGGKIIIHFTLPNAVTPKELGWNADTRKIAINVGSIEFR
ncbi:MAG TPA: hypothetical protein VE779_17860 [Candidatus Angelobacter sp.]|nr:hypothetical protein [Candidatus Angelobacter sp.]